MRPLVFENFASIGFAAKQNEVKTFSIFSARLSRFLFSHCAKVLLSSLSWVKKYRILCLQMDVLWRCVQFQTLPVGRNSKLKYKSTKSRLFGASFSFDNIKRNWKVFSPRTFS